MPNEVEEVGSCSKAEGDAGSLSDNSVGSKILIGLKFCYGFIGGRPEDTISNDLEIQFNQFLLDRNNILTTHERLSKEQQPWLTRTTRGINQSIEICLDQRKLLIPYSRLPQIKAIVDMDRVTKVAPPAKRWIITNAGNEVADGCR